MESVSLKQLISATNWRYPIIPLRLYSRNLSLHFQNRRFPCPLIRSKQSDFQGKFLRFLTILQCIVAVILGYQLVLIAYKDGLNNNWLNDCSFSPFRKHRFHFTALRMILLIVADSKNR